MDNHKLKIGVFITLFLILLATLFYGIFGFSLSYLSEEEIKEGRKLKEDLISFFKINNIDTVYDKTNNTYYYTIPDNYENQKYTLKLELDDSYKYKIVNHTTNIITVDYDKEYKIIIYNDEYYYETKLILTNLPLISITTDTEITDNDTNSIFKYINPYNLDEVLSYSSKIHIRGATSRNFNKKSYKLEIYDNDYDNEKNINISNFYYGSSFILDAMYRDNSKIRNVFASELWNGMATDFTNVNSYSEYVEVFINEEYVGLYAFTEPINRKNLNLNKSSLNDTSVIIKSTDWITPTASSSFNNIFSDVYLGYELKYPNDTELFSEAWKSILSKISKYYNKTISSSYEDINEIFNMNNYIDAILFNSFINNSDNFMIKNNYFYVKNLSDKVYIQPWDMEFSFGLSHSTDVNYLFVKDMDDYKNILFDIKHKSDKINNLLINRYWNLRRNILSIAYLDNLLDNYKYDLTKGSSNRDSNRWLDYDIEKEIEEIKTWVHNRIKVYDNYIRSLENE